MVVEYEQLLRDIRSCKHCEKHLPFAPRPVVHFSTISKIVVIGQAPGTKVHQTGIPWNDPSGERLRNWLDVSREEFYNTKNFGIVPMGFCYPGRGKSGDLPPRPECAPLWMDKAIQSMRAHKLILLIGQYSQNYFLKDRKKNTLTETVRNWKEYLPDYFVLPHPSPRNNIWLKKNEWFEKEAVPELKKRVHKILQNPTQ